MAHFNRQYDDVYSDDNGLRQYLTKRESYADAVW